MVSALTVHKLTVIYGSTLILHDISIDVSQGSLVAVIGPNGAGKTTFMKSLVGLLPAMAGSISVLGAPFHTNRDKVAYVPQRMTVDWDFPISVYDVVMMGRYGKLGWLKRPTLHDKRIVMDAIEQVDLSSCMHMPIGLLSGGQQQRVFFARALAQQADLYLLDEPFVNIDLVTENALVRLLQNMTRAGKTAIVVHHDVHTVCTYFDCAALLNVHMVAYGPVSDVVTAPHFRSAYGERYITAFPVRVDSK